MLRNSKFVTAAFAAALFALFVNVYWGAAQVRNLTDDANVLLLPVIFGVEEGPIIPPPGNQPPSAEDDFYQTAMDTPLIVEAAAGVLANDSDPEQDPLSASLVDDVSSGELTLNSDGSFHYKPALGFSGKASFTYQASDSLALSNVATATISVTSENSPPVIVSGEVAFNKQIIGTDVERAHSAYGADFDSDGDLDIVATQYGTPAGGVGGMVPWFENVGNGKFEERILDPDLAGAYPSHVADVDLDGDIDVLAGGYDSDTFAWYINDGSANFTRKDIDSSSDGAHSIVTTDLDEDGDIDLVTSSQEANQIAWYENDGSNNFSLHVIDDASFAAKRAEVADIDGDGDLDVVAASYDNVVAWHGEIAWHENDGNQNFSKRIIDPKPLRGYYVFPADIDGDGDIDVLSANRKGDTVAWYRNEGEDGFAKQIVDDNAIEVRTVIGSDLDRDGDIDAIAASVDDDTIAWHENDGSGNFEKKIIDQTTDGAYGVSDIDMDFDGDLDIISASRDNNEIAIHFQYKLHEEMVKKGNTLVIDASILLTTDAEDGPEDLTYTLIEAPKYGDIELANTPLAKGGTFTQDDINNGRVTYNHSGANRTRDGFSFNVVDSQEDSIKPADGAFSIKIR